MSYTPPTPPLAFVLEAGYSPPSGGSVVTVLSDASGGGGVTAVGWVSSALGAPRISRLQHHIDVAADSYTVPSPLDTTLSAGYVAPDAGGVNSLLGSGIAGWFGRPKVVSSWQSVHVAGIDTMGYTTVVIHCDKAKAVFGAASLM